MSDIWTRFRERKLFQWAAAYAAVAIVAVELLGQIGDSFGWPAWANRAVLILAALGFLLVTVLAWYHGEKGNQRVTSGEVLALSILGVVGGAALWALAPVREPGNTEAEQAALFPESVGSTRVGIIPFDALGPGMQEDGWVATALREEITTQLTKIRALGIVRSDSRFRDVSTFPLAAMADSLQVRYLLGASVLTDGDAIRVTVWIHDADQEREVWRESYDGALSARSLMDIQTSVAFGVARELEAGLAPTEVTRISRRYTHDDRAYTLYLQGLELASRGAAVYWPEVVEAMERAVAIDSLFAPAWSWLGLAYVSIGNYYLLPETLPPDSAFARAGAAARRALELDESLADAHVTMGFVHFSWRRDWEAAEAEVRRALELSPTVSSAYYLLAFLRLEQGDFQGAMAAADRMVELSPVNGSEIRFSARMRHMARRYPEALALFERSMVHSPDARGVHLYMALTHEQLGMTREAVEDLRDFAERDPRMAGRAHLLTEAYQVRGMAGVWEVWLSWMAEQDQPRPSEMAIPHARLAQADSAVYWLERGAAVLDSWLLQLADPLWDPVRAHPGFQRLVERRGLPPRG